MEGEKENKRGTAAAAGFCGGELGFGGTSLGGGRATSFSASVPSHGDGGVHRAALLFNLVRGKEQDCEAWYSPEDSASEAGLGAMRSSTRFRLGRCVRERRGGSAMASSVRRWEEENECPELGLAGLKLAGLGCCCVDGCAHEKELVHVG